MIDVRKLNPKYVKPNGRYADLSVPIIVDLTDEEILALRKYYNDPSIAYERVNRKEREVQNKNYKVTREQKYNIPSYKIRKKPKKGIGTKVIIGGLVITFVIFGNNLLDKTLNNKGEYQQVSIVTNYDSGRVVSNNFDDDLVLEEVYFEDEEIANRKSTIKRICDIYQVNFDVAYEYIANITGNFSSEDFLDGTLDETTCKGETIVTSSEEEMYVYLVRKIKQVPELLNISTSNLYVNNGYDSGSNYAEQIEWAANIVGIDKSLAYAICYSETNFDSDIFLYNNNPAGILNEAGDWWNFDTKEEGFLELCMEVRKYYRMIGERNYTKVDENIIAQIGAIHCPLNDPKDINGLNNNWVINVIDRYNYAKANEADLFSGVTQNNGLSH